MAYKNICGFETGDTSECYSVDGTYSIQSTTKRSGTYSAQFNVSSSYGRVTVAGISSTGAPAALALTTIYYTYYLRFASFPATDSVNYSTSMVALFDSGGNEGVRVYATSAGKLVLYGATTSSETSAMSLNTWHRVDVKFVKNGTCELQLDGGTAVTCTGRNQTGSYILFGPMVGGSTVNMFIDDIAISDSAIPGKGQVNICKPNGNGNYTAWTGTYTDVDEIPHNTDTDYLTSSTSGQAETVALESASTAGVSGTIGTVKGVGIIRDEGGASSFALRLRSSSTDSTNTALDPGSTYVCNSRILDTDPATSSAWTSSGIDGLEVGVVNSASVAARVTMLCAMVWSSGSVLNLKSIDGTMGALTGTITKKALKAASGTSGSLTGAITKKTNKTLTGISGSLSGVLSSHLAVLYLQSLAGTCGDLVGSLSKKTYKSFSGSIDNSGSVIKNTIKSLTGTCGSLSGVISKITSKVLSGISGSISGSISRIIIKYFSGELSQTGTVAKLTKVNRSGTLGSLSGSISFRFPHAIIKGAAKTLPVIIHAARNTSTILSGASVVIKKITGGSKNNGNYPY